MKKISIVLLPIIISTAMEAQQKMPTGIYYLKGIMETASGFKFNEDSSFEFFFSYGASDRYGKGKWQKKGNTILLNSRPYPGRDFRLLTSKQSDNSAINIKIADKYKELLPFIYITLKTNNKIIEPINSEDGIITFSKLPADSIILQSDLCPERSSIFPIIDKTHNYFEFTIEPWLTEVFFSNFSLSLDKGNLKGSHPLIENEEFYYEKEE